MTDVSQLLESRRARIGRWSAAALIACALHAGGIALALMHQPEEEDADDTAGALTVELAPLPAPKPVDTPDVAHGPEQQVAKLTPEASKPVVEKVEEDIPPVEPSPAQEPEVVLPKPKPDETERPKDEAKEAAPRDAVPQQDVDVPVTTAPPRVEAPPAVSTARADGQSAAIARAQASWQTALLRQLNRKRVPPGARGRRGQWEVVVAFTLDRTGKVLDSRITKSSGLPVLDQEAQDLLRRVTFPPSPDELPGTTFEYSLPIRFGVR
jgi:periplasmic protein TonB